MEAGIIDAEISKLLSKGLIVNTTREANDYVSGMFTRNKKDGNYIMILNLKSFNEFLKFKHCKLESVEDALGPITEGCYFGKEECYQYIALSNRFSPAARVFTKF